MAEPSVGQKIARWFGAVPKQKIGQELFVKPITETAAACKAPFEDEGTSGIQRLVIARAISGMRIR
ncbi:hypothetical protein ACIBL3_29455 [Kribbella sp. NPDC050124]|uniref:hypothetical protein n=1 Tax=Kribbella sp. NPDC050124 TaxID=3364114 RepID=UPI0037AAF090